jgi:hypothetical protein
MPGRQKALQRNAAKEVEHAEHDQYNSSIAKTIDTQVATDSEPPTADQGGTGRFFSGDNPIVVVMGALGIFIALQIATHPR